MQYNFENEKKQIIEKVEKYNLFIEEMLNNDRGLFSIDEKAKLRNILDKNSKYLHKLKTNEFEIAIVGLENSGKSTFANALIENEVLPSASDRCTFTSTRLICGEDEAIVELYTRKEFNKIFISMLEDINYPDASSKSYDTLSIEEFENYFESLKDSDSNLYNLHQGKTDEEIKDILKYASKLELTGDIKRFSGEQLLQEQFQSYIKGVKIDNIETDSSKPRSVKKIEIKSSRLDKLKNAIIYDVPGFDSPTKIHERQTLERLKKADAIIFITNVGDKPNITAPQLDTIRKDTDVDGIPLRDKLFVFGNKLDQAEEKDREKHRNILVREVVSRYQMAEAKRVYTGSAKQYLYEKGKVKDFNSVLEDSEIEKIRNSLISYYENERFEILKRKIDTQKRELQTIFQKVSQIEIKFNENVEETEKTKIQNEAIVKIGETLRNNLEEIKATLKKEIWDEKYFSNKFKTDVENQNYFAEITDDEIEKAYYSVDESATQDIPIEHINKEIRKILHKKFLKEFTNLILSMSDEKAKEIEIRILRSFTDAIVGNNKLLFDQIEKESEILIKKLTKRISHNDEKFIYLIERFARNIFDVLITHRLGSIDRKNKFQAVESEYRYLDSFYNNSDKSLINIILTGKKQSLSKMGLEDVLNIGIKLKKITDSDYINLNEKIDYLKDVAERLLEIGGVYNIEEITKTVEPAKTKDEVLNEVNNDIKNLRDILQNAVVPATNLEMAFVNAIDKQIKTLIDSFTNVNSEGFDSYNEFISKVVVILKDREIKGIKDKIELKKSQQEIIKKIRQFEI
jgi:hypothetical protein